MTNLTTEEMQRIVDGAEQSDGNYHLGFKKYFSGTNARNLNDLRTILSQQQEIEQLRELVGDVLIDNHRQGLTTPKTLNAIQNYVSEGESDE